MAVVDRDLHLGAVAGPIGGHNGVELAVRLNDIGAPRSAAGYADSRCAVHGDGIQIRIGDGEGHAAAVDRAVVHTGDDRRGGIQHHAVGPQIGDVARRIGDPCIGDEPAVGGDGHRRSVGPEGHAVQLRRGIVLLTEQVLDGRHTAGLVRRRQRHGLPALVEQVKADGIPEALPRVALVDTDLAGGIGLVDLVGEGDGLGDITVRRVLHIEGQAAGARLIGAGQAAAPIAVGGIGAGQPSAAVTMKS